MVSVDLAVVGSGSAAFAAAIHARDLGRSVVLVERGTVGGTCVNVGCIPSKSLIAAANERWRAARNAFPGVATSAGEVDMRELLRGAGEIVGALRQRKYLDLAAQHGIDLRSGEARFVAPDELQVDGERLEARAVIIATGSAPTVPPIPGLRDAGYLTSTTLLELDELPPSMVVLGGGYVGLEYAQAFSRLGSSVTLIARSGIAKNEEPPIRDALREALRGEGITLIEQATVRRVERMGELRRVHLDTSDGARSVDGHALLVATGRRANTEPLGLAQAGIETDATGFVIIDEQMATTNDWVWAAGDCCDVPQFVYVAAQMGLTAATNALERADRSIDFSALPRITFTDPTLAAVGLTEEQAHAQGIDCRCHTIDLEPASRPWVDRDLRGAIRIVARRDNEQVIGMSVLAAHAEHVILAGQLAVRHELTLSDLRASWTPYLTLGEAVKLTAVSFERDPSQLSCCA